MQTWRSLPDSNEVPKDLPEAVVTSVETTLDRMAVSNVFIIAKRKHANKDVFYFSAKIPRGIPFLIELTLVVRVPGVKCAIKTPNPELAPLFFEAIETLLKSWGILLHNHRGLFYYRNFLSLSVSVCKFIIPAEILVDLSFCLQRLLDCLLVRNHWFLY